MQKEIHVNSYVKRDGTRVREHNRSINSNNSIMSEQERVILDENPYGTAIPRIEYDEYGNPMVLTGRIEYDDFRDGSVDRGSLDRGSSGGDSVGDIVSEVVKVISEVTPMVAQLVSALNSGNRTSVAYWQPQVNTKIEQINLKQNQIENIIKEYSKKLARTKDKEEYTKLYEILSKSNIPHKKLSSMVYAVNALTNNGNYAQAAAELENFKNNSTPLINDSLLASNNIQKGGINTPSAKTNIPASQIAMSVPKTVVYNEKLTNNQTNKVNSNALFHGHPDFQKGFIDFGMSLMDTFTFGKMVDTNSLWKISANKLEHDLKYINENCSFLESIEQLPPNVRDIVRQKLVQQINQDDARGVIFYSWSTLAKGIGHSKEFHEYIIKNMDKLNNDEIIESGSTYFGSDINLKYALGHADILFTQINKDGNVSAIIMDTYDFNKSDTNWMVKIAHDVQDAGLIENYYLLIYVLIPLYEIFGF